MRPFYLILTTYSDGQLGASDPQPTLDDAADAYGEAQKDDPRARQVVMVDVAARAATDVTPLIERIIALRMEGRAA